MAAVAGKQSGSRDSSHSGRLLLRMPRALHARLAERAEAEGRSLNQHIVETLTLAVDGGLDAGTAEGAPRSAPRSLRLALVANALVVVLAAVTCIVLLIVALR